MRERVGLFDVSHMGELEFRGAGALAALQRLTCNDVARLADGRIHYSALLTDRGTFVDDILVYRRAADDVSSWSSTRPTRRRTSPGRRRGTRGDASVEDRSDDYALIAVQGPQRRPAHRGGSATPDPSDLPYYGFREDTRLPAQRRSSSRTGYTGEDGFEIFCRPDGRRAASCARCSRTGEPDGAHAVRPRRARHAAPRGADGALRQRHRRHDQPARGGPRLDREARQGRFRRARRARRAEGRRAFRASWSVSRWSAAASRATAIPARAARGAGRRHRREPIRRPSARPSASLYCRPRRGAIGTEFDVDIRGRDARARVIATPFYKRTGCNARGPVHESRKSCATPRATSGSTSTETSGTIGITRPRPEAARRHRLPRAPRGRATCSMPTRSSARSSPSRPSPSSSPRSSGEVAEVNKAAVTEPGIVNDDPFGDGWLIKVKLSTDEDVARLDDRRRLRQVRARKSRVRREKK